MPSLNLLSRLYRKKTTIFAGDGSSSATPRVTPEPRASQSENALSRTSLSSPLERRIHPDLNALAAELSSDIHDFRHTNEASPLPRAIPSQTGVTIPPVSLTPWTRDRHNIPSVTQTTNITTHETRTENAPEPTSSDKSINASPQGNVSPTPSNERSESRANRIFNRITGLGVRASPTPNPPSAWNTFGRRRSRRHNPIPHASDFGASPDVSLSNSQRSRASSNQTSPWYATENSADTSGSLSMSLQSISQSHSRSQSQSNSFHTPSHAQHHHSPPSSAFTFGPVGPRYGQTPPSALPAYPALRFSIFGGEEQEVPDWPNSREGREMHGDTNPDLNLQPLQPRTSASMPSLSRHRTFDLGSHNSIKTGTGSSRPRAQHIFPASSSLDQLSTKVRRRTTTRSSGTGSSHGSRRRRNVRRNLREDSSAEVPGLSETRADNIETSKSLGTAFRIQQVPPSVPDNLPVNANNSSAPSPPHDSLHSHIKRMSSVRTTTPPRRMSPHPSRREDDQMNAGNKGKGKGKEKMISSRTSSIRNEIPPGALAEFPGQHLPSSRPSTPLRSAMVSTSRFKTSSPQSIPLATSTSASSLNKGKRKVDEVDGEGEDILNEPVEQQQRRNMHRATFADEPRKYRTSTSSHTTSNARRKRARLSSGTSFATNQTVSEHGVRAPSRAGSHRRHAPYAASSASRGSHTPPQSSVKVGSVSSHQRHSVRYAGQPQRARHPSSTRASSKRGSVSQASIPISALISPHAPSISLRPSTAYHMRDPRKPPPVHPTPWSLSFPSAGSHERSWSAGFFDIVTCSTFGDFFERRFRRHLKEEETDPEKQTHARGEENNGKFPVVDWIEGGGSPIHAWLFFLGFVLFPAWWIAGLFIAVPKTRMLGGGSGPEEKSVVLDDPQVEHDAKSWRKRCRVMAAISLLTYVPFIVLVVIFVPRS